MVTALKKVLVSHKINSLSETAPGWSCLGRYLEEDNRILYTRKKKYVRYFNKKSVDGGRVLACKKKIVSKSFKDVVNVLEMFYGKFFEVSLLSYKYFEHINTIKIYYREKHEAGIGHCRRVNVRKLEEYTDRKKTRIPVPKQLALIDKYDLLVSSDYFSLYPSTKAHLDSEWPKIETAKAINIEDSDRQCSSFNNGNWKSLKNQDSSK